MRRSLAVAGLVLGAIGAGRAARAAEVRVVDDTDRPVADVMVACMGQETGAGLSGPDGVATVPDACREVYCERGDLVNDRAKIVGGKATCRVRAGVVMTVTAPLGTCADGCWVWLTDADDTGPRVGTIAGGVPRRASNGWLGRETMPVPPGIHRKQDPGRWTSKPVMPGHLRLSVGAGDDASPWSCETDLRSVPAGAAQETAVWRAPVEVAGRVLDRDEKPVSDVPLFVHPETPPADGAKRVWTCSAQDKNQEPVSGSDGSFRVRIDPAVPVRIDAGWKNYPIGTASVTLHGKPDGELVLRLK